MYQKSEIACLAETIAINGSVGTDYEQLSDSLAPTTAIEIVNDVHPLITPENISSCFRSADTMGINAWNNSTNYLKNQRVSYSGSIWKAKQNNANQTPGAGVYWEQVSIVSSRLTEIVSSACNKMLKKVFEFKQLNQTVKTILEDFFLYNGRADISNLNANLGRLVGLRFNVRDAKDIALLIKQVSLQLVGDEAQFDLYLFHSSNKQPIHTIQIQYQENGSVKWFDANKLLKYVAEEYDSGGCWYLVYSEAETNGAQSLKKEKDFVTPPDCSSCDQAYYTNFVKRSHYVNIQPFYVNEGNYSSGELWDVNDEVYVNNNNFGLNFSMTAQCDLGNFICRNKGVFAEALAYQVAVDILGEFCNTTRNNQLADKVRSEAYFALNGDKNTMNSGLIKEYEKKIKSVSFNISDLNKNCLPCENKPKVKYSAI